ncbi:GPI inositol-deacylase [Halocaridina rubra]|uniref:GPI inositol-deacylase n=1 Tax=Halocaridina rubra TaxID=373956 RepID=A0AAN8WIV8_HALRR
MASAIKAVVAGLLFALLLGGTYDHIYKIEPNRCHMTYMFELPEYIPVMLPPTVKKLYPYYHLYSYGEGNYSQMLKDGLYEGIPVLFIPGNGGSYKQVRSLASVAYRKALDDETYFHFNFFSVDLNSELGAFYGPALKRQTEFVAYAIKQILRIYEGSMNPPKSVVLVGHSMGGIVARAVYISQNITSSSLPLIISQATPHTRPVLNTDHHLKDFYEYVNTYWERERLSNLENTVLIAVGGGRNDIQVSTSHINSPFADIATTTASIPSCWLTTDHQAIVWCKQLVMPLVRSLFDIVDLSTMQISTDRQMILDVFEFHLAKRITGKRFKHSLYSKEVDFDEHGDWIEITARQYAHTANKTKHPTYLLLPFHPNHQQYHKATIIATNLGKRDWVMACNIHLKQHRKICTEGENLSKKTKKLYGRVKSVQLDLGSLSNIGHSAVVVYIAPTDEKVEVYIDVHSKTGRHRSIEIPVFLRSFTQTIIVDTTPQKALFYNISLVGLQNLWQSFSVTVRPRQKCNGQSIITTKLYMPWAQKELYLQRNGIVDSFSAELDVAPPAGDNTSASIQFFFSPKCSYSIILQGSLLGVFRRLIWLYGAHIPTYLAAHLLLTLSLQLKGIDRERYCPSYFSAMLSLSPLSLVPFVKLLSILLRNVGIKDDFSFLSDHGEDLGILPVLLFLGTWPLSLAIGAFTWGMVIISGKITHSFLVKILGRSIGGGAVIGDLALSGISRLPVIVGVAFISLAYSTCGTLSLCLSCLFHFTKVFRLYEDYIETTLLELIPGVVTEKGKSINLMSSLNIHITLMLLVFFNVIINFPSFMMWVKYLSYSLQLHEDPSLPVSVGLLIILCLLWQKDLPCIDREYYKHLANAVHILAILTTLFGSIHIYRVPYFVVCALLLLALHQLLAPVKLRKTSSANEAPSDGD